MIKDKKAKSENSKVKHQQKINNKHTIKESQHACFNQTENNLYQLYK